MKKKIIFCIVAAALMAGGTSGCGKDDSGQVNTDLESPSKSTSQEGPVRLFTDAIEAYNGQDLAALIALFDPGIEWTHETASKKTIQGRAPLAKALIQERGSFPDCTIGMERIIVHDKDLVVQGVFRGTHRGMVHNIEPTGKKVSYKFIYFVSTEDGKITRNICYFNPAAALKHVGAISVEKAPFPKWSEKFKVVRGKSDAKNIELVKQFYSLWEAGDLDKLDELVSAEFNLEICATVESFTDLAEVKNYMKKVHTEFGKMKFVVKHMSAVGPYVVVRSILTGVHRMKPEGQDKPADKELEISHAHVFKLLEGKLVKADIYFDEFLRYQQFGYSIAGALKQMSDVKSGADAGLDERAGTKDLAKEPVEKGSPKKPADKDVAENTAGKDDAPIKAGEDTPNKTK
ncbi:MAG: nuclear transport factor 2 family protein [Proteobacteria bacterium]|nr:nuclear transport factor 2 family protein [Pseudomonadota bacterium]